MANENRWTWVGTGREVGADGGYDAWRPGQPDNRHGDQHCMYADAGYSGRRRYDNSVQQQRTPAGGWNDWHCFAARLNFVCEIVLQPWQHLAQALRPVSQSVIHSVAAQTDSANIVAGFFTQLFTAERTTLIWRTSNKKLPQICRKRYETCFIHAKQQSMLSEHDAHVLYTTVKLHHYIHKSQEKIIKSTDFGTPRLKF